MFTFLCVTAFLLFAVGVGALIADAPHSRDELWRANEEWFERLIEDQEYGWCCVCEFGQTRKSWGEQLSESGKPTLRSDFAFLRFRLHTKITSIQMSWSSLIYRQMTHRWPTRYPHPTLDFVLAEHDGYHHGGL